MQRGASLTTSEHIDPASPPAQLADMEDPDNADIPEGAIRFNVTAEDIAAALAEDSIEVFACPAINVLVLSWSDYHITLYMSCACIFIIVVCQCRSEPQAEMQMPDHLILQQHLNGVNG